MTMNKEKIQKMLSRSRSVSQESDECLVTEHLAAYLDGSLRGEHRKTAKVHLADCSHCLDRASAIVRSEDESDFSIPARLLQKAETLPPGRDIRRIPRWAAAAVAALAVGLMLQQPLPVREGSVQSEPRQVRYSDRNALQPQVLAPEDGSVIYPSEQIFRWTEVPGSLFYDVRLVSSDGDLLVRERVQDTRWLIPHSMGLEEGQEYYVRVDAWLNDSKFLSSEHVVFMIRGED